MHRLDCLRPIVSSPGRPLVGIEIESETIPLSEHFEYLCNNGWEIHEDGSLRGEYPLEAVMLPCNGPVLAERLHAYEQLADDYADMDEYGWRCSTHIHLNLLDELPSTIRTLIPITLQADNFIYALAEHRRGNHNCYPLSLLKDLLLDLLDLDGMMAANLDDARFGDILLDHRRYMGTNWASLRKHGTLEFRHFPGTNKTAELLRMVATCERLLMVARECSPDYICQLFEQDIEAWGQLVFENAWAELKYSGWRRDYVRALELVKQYRSLRPSDDSFHRRLQKEFVVGA